MTARPPRPVAGVITSLTETDGLAELSEDTTTVEPGSTPLGAALRRLLLDGDDVSPRAEALMMANAAKPKSTPYSARR